MRRTFAFAVVVGLVFVAMTMAINRAAPREVEFGATFSTVYARQLGLDPKKTFLEALDELKIRQFRIPVYWSEIEPATGGFDFDELDWMLEEAGKRGAKVTLAIGRKVPRWPECFIPDWAEQLDASEAKQALLSMLETVVLHYRDHPAVEQWQVENEPFFPFGVCPLPDRALFLDELALVRSLDKRPILLTVSGEIDPWIDAARHGDALGISLYRVTWNRWYGYAFYPLSPLFYGLRARVLAPFVPDVVISELQAEPWFSRPASELNGKERAELFTPRDLTNQVEFARRTGISQAWVWGIEWWAAQREHGDASLWKVGKEVFK